MIHTLSTHPWITVAGALVLLTLLEEITVVSPSCRGGAQRVATNFLLYVCSLGVLALAAFTLPALAREQRMIDGFGMSAWLSLAWPAGLLVLFLVDSFLAYWLHRVSHHWPVLWRIHAVHHADRWVDATTAVRHHPLEVLPALVAQLASIIICGATSGQAVAVALFNTGWALATHASIGSRRLHFPPGLRFLVSSSFHRLHHSSDEALTNSNYGNTLTVWDYAFDTAREPATESLCEVGLGTGYLEDDKFGSQLVAPFRTRTETYGCRR